MRHPSMILGWAAWMSASLLVFLSVLLTIDVLSRKLLDRPIVGVFEVSCVGLLFVTFLGLGWAQHKKRQLRIDVLANIVTGKCAHLLELINNSLVLIFFGLILWQGMLEWASAWQKSATGRGLIQIPDIIPISGLVLGSILICLRCLVGSLRSVSGILSRRTG